MGDIESGGTFVLPTPDWTLRSSHSHLDFIVPPNSTLGGWRSSNSTLPYSLTTTSTILATGLINPFAYNSTFYRNWPILGLQHSTTTVSRVNLCHLRSFFYTSYIAPSLGPVLVEDPSIYMLLYPY